MLCFGTWDLTFPAVRNVAWLDWLTAADCDMYVLSYMLPCGCGTGGTASVIKKHWRRTHRGAFSAL